MIRAYNKTNQFQESLEMYHFMCENKIEPDKFTFTFVVKACTGLLDLKEGVLVHEKIVEKGLEGDVFIGTGLVDMYCKMGELVSAEKVFDVLPERDVVTWNAMIAGFSQSFNPEDGLVCFKRMQVEGLLEPNSVSLLNLFPAVCKLGDVKACRCIHGFVFRREFPVAVSNGLIDMYCKCGWVGSGENIFYLMRGRDDVSWGTMMAGYVHNKLYDQVIELHDKMKGENMIMDKVSAVCALLAAAEMRDLEKGIEIHDCIKHQRIGSDVRVVTPLITMYAKCGELQKAKKLFAGLQERDLVSWSALIASTAQCGEAEEAFSLFRDMQSEKLKPTKVTLLSVLPVCGELLCANMGKSIHCFSIKADIDSDVSIGTTLVSMYAKCDIFSVALTVFNRMLHKEIVTWNALINGYAQIVEPYKAMDLYYQLQLSGLHPDSGTVVGVLPACALLEDLRYGRCIHGTTVKLGFGSDCHVRNALIDMYAKCGNLLAAEFLFYKTDFVKDEVSWNTMISGYIQNGHAQKAISVFNQMKIEAFVPNLVTIVSILPAIAYLAALREGMALHCLIVQTGLHSNTLIGNSLIDMYAKCGRLDHAEKFFIEMHNKDTVTWNAMLAGYAVHGHGAHATEFFSVMEESHVKVDSVSFVSALSACRHAGLVEEGRKIFCSMREKHHILPNLKHYACMVDLLAHAGLFDETLSLIKTMPMEPDAGVWGAFLDACKMHDDVDLAELALKNLVRLEPGNPAHYVVLSTIYAQSGRWGEARSTRLQMTDTGMRKTPGCSWLEDKGIVHGISSG
ncbi:Pentatricopeptide repeat-containing protein [Heracleum sosnowskyi]|uniref:Pentatricopeptide repeat-containing protein n=1 Tax=Heracleum sosnowskyi TaxID=360622 RepID=A0AAD8GW77_9APIA|nr:Pentatricopeptide repeat-containing protein [Heracleum sosnowskyi]